MHVLRLIVSRCAPRLPTLACHCPTCSFDYGNAETDNDDDGPGTMEALYVGTWGDRGQGKRPWVLADMECVRAPAYTARKRAALPLAVLHGRCSPHARTWAHEQAFWPLALV